MENLLKSRDYDVFKTLPWHGFHQTKFILRVVHNEHLSRVKKQLANNSLLQRATARSYFFVQEAKKEKKGKKSKKYFSHKKK